MCDHARCPETATVKVRFGDGWTTTGQRQTFVHYCDMHFQTVDRLFMLCDVTLLARAA